MGVNYGVVVTIILDVVIVRDPCDRLVVAYSLCFIVLPLPYFRMDNPRSHPRHVICNKRTCKTTSTYSNQIIC